MRHYDRVSYRHLNDSERYRDHEYLADDAWIGAKERVYGTMEQQRSFDGQPSYERGDGRDDYARGERGSARTRELTYRLDVPRDQFQARESRDTRETRERRPSRRPMREVMRHPASFLGRVVRGIFHGRGPKNWMRSDTRIHDDVCELLARHEGVDASNVDVVVKDGEVTLTGTVADRFTKRLAEQTLDDVLGVKDVHNRLTVARSH